jgi:ribose/xylose/arabinose/galactoside ABC-type transport system permease subunit
VALFWLSWRFPDFRTGANGAVILSRVAEIGIVAAGMTLVIGTGGIDISVGSIVGLCGVALGVLTVNRGWSLWTAVLATIGAGAGCGLVNGLLIAQFRLPPIIATLAMFSAARAGAYVLSNSESISGLPEALTNFGYGSWPTLRLPSGDTLPVPLAAWVALGVLLVTGILLKKTTFGRGLLALGGNREATFLSGLRIRRTEVVVYVISGALAALQAIVVTARQATSVPDAGKYFELSAITTVVLGGTSVMGGQATVLGTALGVVTISVVQNGVQQYKQDSMVAMIVTGIVLLASVEVDRIRRTGLFRRRSIH